MLTATEQKPQKSLKGDKAHRLSVNVMLSNDSNILTIRRR